MYNIWQGQWRRLRRRIKQRWANLTDRGPKRINSQYDQLVGMLQQCHGQRIAFAEARVSDFLSDVPGAVKRA